MNVNSTLIPPQFAQVVVIGAGPAGLMAAQVLAQAGHCVRVFERMPTVGRKLLRAGVGGLNITHSESSDLFVTRYGERQALCERWLKAWGQADLLRWVQSLGVETFVGSSGRVFPKEMKAAPLLRAWLRRLQSPILGQPVHIATRHRWEGGLVPVPRASGATAWAVDLLGPDGPVRQEADAVVLALGGGSWPQLGSDGAWVPWLSHLGLNSVPLAPANCGFDVAHGQGWIAYFAQHFAGTPLKTVVLHCKLPDGRQWSQRGELVITRTGIEGSLVYAASAHLREAIASQGAMTIELDLKPDWSQERLTAVLAAPRRGRSLSTLAKTKLGFTAVQCALLYEVLSPQTLASPHDLACAIKQLPITLTQARPLAEAISTAGGVDMNALTHDLMVRHLPGVFVAGEMLDWEAPTGGYLLTASWASGHVAGQGARAWLHQHYSGG